MFSHFFLTSPLQAMTTIRIMACQHRDFRSQLDNAKRLWLYAQSVVSKHQALDASLAKEESKLKRLKQEAKDGAEKIERSKKEKDEAKQEAKLARLAVVAVGKAMARAEDDLTGVRDALAAAEEDLRRLEAEVSHLTVERTSLVLAL